MWILKCIDLALSVSIIWFLPSCCHILIYLFQRKALSTLGKSLRLFGLFNVNYRVTWGGFRGWFVYRSWIRLLGLCLYVCRLPKFDFGYVQCYLALVRCSTGDCVLIGISDLTLLSYVISFHFDTFYQTLMKWPRQTNCH